MADYSKCIEYTLGYGTFFKKHSGKVAVSFCITNSSGERVYGKSGGGGGSTDTLWGTDACITRQTFWLEYLQMSCGSQSMALLDGSAGTRITGVVGCNSSSGGYLEWDLRKDPIACLTAENTQALCVSAQGGAGFGSLYLEGYWGQI